MKTSPVEYPRYFRNAELRVVDGGGEGKPPKIVGYAAVFNSLSADLGGFREKVSPGAFRDALAANEEVLALVEHDPKMVLGRRSKGTLRLSEDDRGLYCEIDPPNTRAGQDLIENVRRGDIQGMSFRFPRGATDSWEIQNGEAIRTLEKVGLMEVTCTAIPAYESTSVNIRALNDQEEAEMRSYYQAKIDALKPKVEPPAAPDLSLYEKRLRLMGVEQRAEMKYDDKSLIYFCRETLRYNRIAFDQLQYLIDAANAVTGKITEADQSAIDDCLSSIHDLLAKAKAARMSLDKLGAQDTGTTAAA